MTPKQKYDERKRLRIENDLRMEQRRQRDLDRAEDVEDALDRIMSALERIADVLELWADQQSEGGQDHG